LCIGLEREMLCRQPEVRMRRSLCVLAGVAAVSIALESPLSGQNAAASLTVSASVSKNCTITTSPVNFGAYDPVAANATAPLDGIGTIVVTCTKGAVAKAGLNPGSNAEGTTRRMSQGAAAYLSYELYKDTAHSAVWGDTTDTALDIPAAPNRNPRTFSVYGRVNPAQDATVGSYTDTVVATVNF
jgi:spore coat protein U-like protein